MNFWPPGRMVHAPQSIKPVLKSVNDGFCIITFKYWPSQSAVRMSFLSLRKLITVLHTPVKHHLTCSFSVGITILHITCMVCIIGEAYTAWDEDRALSG